MIYTLYYGDTQAQVDTVGAEMLSYITAKGTSCLWNGDPDIWMGHSPHLFPVIGTLKDSVHLCKGQKMPMSKHGFLRNTQFEVVEQKENTITLLRTENEQSLAQYPFKFQFFVTHILMPNGFVTNYRIENCDVAVMPFCVGGHPSFACPLFAGECFEDYELLFDAPVDTYAMLATDDFPLMGNSFDSLPIVNNTLKLSHSLLDSGVIVFRQSGCNGVTLFSHKNSYAMHLSFAGFPNFALWSFCKRNAPYLCIEPWHGLPCMVGDGATIASKPYCIELKPTEQKELSYSAIFTE